jgi:hypothetical protein
VSAAVVYFWNDGKLPIKTEDVLEPLKIELDPNCEIIDARILRVTRAVTRFARGEVSDKARNSLPLSFGILEHEDGGAVQIIYTGKPDTRVSATGTIVGAGSPHQTLDRPNGDPLRSKGVTAITSRIALLTALGFGIYFFRQRQKIVLRFGKMRYRLAMTSILLTAIAYGFVVVVDYRASQPVVPANLWVKD